MSLAHTLPVSGLPATALKEWRIPVEGMSCASCVARVEKVTVHTAQDREKVAAALAEAGYPTA